MHLNTCTYSQYFSFKFFSSIVNNVMTLHCENFNILNNLESEANIVLVLILNQNNSLIHSQINQTWTTYLSYFLGGKTGNLHEIYFWRTTRFTQKLHHQIF